MCIHINVTSIKDEREFMTKEKSSQPSVEKYQQAVAEILHKAVCTEECKQKLADVLYEYRDVLAFKDEAIGTSNLFKQDIPLITTRAIRTNQYPIPKMMHEAMNDWVKEMLGYNIIRPSRSPYNSPFLMVKKKT